MAASGLCLPSPTPKPHGGGRRPLGGPPEPLQLRLPTGGWWGPPVRGSSPRHPPSTCRDPLTPPLSPPVPHPGWGGSARACGLGPRRTLLHYTGSAGPQESGGAPRCPERPPRQQLVLKANRRLAGCCAGRTRRPGASYPPPTGVCTHGTGHRHPLGGSHTATHHSTTATGGRESPRATASPRPRDGADRQAHPGPPFPLHCHPPWPSRPTVPAAGKFLG